MPGDLTRNISTSEIECKCGCGLRNIDPIAIEMAQDAVDYFAEMFRRPLRVYIHSGCRCREYNEVVQKENNPDYAPYSSKSTHMPDSEGICRAIDFHIEAVSHYSVYKYLDEMYPNCNGLAKYSWGVHLDSKPGPARRW